VFRGFHTIKGMSGFLNLTDIQSLAHAAESLLDLGRKGKLQLAGHSMDVIFESVDMLKGLMSALKEALATSTPVPRNPGLPALLQTLRECAEGGPGAPGASADKTAAQTAAPAHGSAAAPAKASAVAEAGDVRAAEPAAATPTPGPAQPTATAAPSKGADAAAAKAAVSDEKIKVSTGRLDSLVNMVGELVIAQSMVMREASGIVSSDDDLFRTVSHQGKIVRELQELSMMMRMVPIQGVFQKMARLVRDLSQKSGKKVNFHTEGEETELDRIVVDQIGDPLVHMVRNSIDHGLEPEEERVAAGKDPVGNLSLRAFHQSGNIIIEIQDDGRGLNKEKILKKGIEQGFVAPGQELSEQEIFRLIFHAGLSTAAKVTDVSGRGVGMDVVKKNIEALRGKVEIASTWGAGTTFTIRLPLTMAIIEGQIVRIGASQYIVPIGAIESCLRPAQQQIHTVQGRAEMATVQGRLLPVVRLYKLFGVKPDSELPWESSLVVVQEDGKTGCLVVDELLGQHQVVIKSLGDGIGHIKGIAGGAIMGNGRISLIIDVPGLLEMACR